MMQYHAFLSYPSSSVCPRLSTSTIKSNYSISDKDLESRGFYLRRTPNGLNLAELNNIFAKVGFPRRDPAKVLIALENSHSIVWVEDTGTSKPVAFARAIGDGVFNAVVWDVVVNPSFQGIGLGKVIIERLVDDLLSLGISNITLYAEPKVIGFYRPLGFTADPDGIKGMAYSTKEKPSKTNQLFG